MNTDYFGSYTTLLNDDLPLYDEAFGINSVVEHENIVEANVLRKPQMTKNFTQNEDICIVLAWLHTSKDIIHEGDQTFSRFGGGFTMNS